MYVRSRGESRKTSPLRLFTPPPPPCCHRVTVWCMSGFCQALWSSKDDRRRRQVQQQCCTQKFKVYGVFVSCPSRSFPKVGKCASFCCCLMSHDSSSLARRKTYRSRSLRSITRQARWDRTQGRSHMCLNLSGRIVYGGSCTAVPQVSPAFETRIV